MGFDDGWTDRVLCCVESVSFSVLINGKPSRIFTPERGLRQGDPLSPYLFYPIGRGYSRGKSCSALARDNGFVHDGPGKLFGSPYGWKGTLLSKAGREVLIKAVAQSIPTYAMSVSKLPSTFCDELRRLISQFWWGHNQGERKIHWVAWEKLCTPKIFGGLGFRNYQILCTRGDSLAARAELGGNPSFTWRSIWEARWILSPKPEDCELVLDKVQGCLLAFEADMVLNTCLSLRRPPDDCVRSAYKAISNTPPGEDEPSSSETDRWIWASIWKTKTLLRIKLFFWQLCRGEETELHLFRDCSRVREVWECAKWDEWVDDVGRFDVVDWIQKLWEVMGEKERGKLMMICWWVWRSRCEVVFEGRVFSGREVFGKAMNMLLEMKGEQESKKKGHTFNGKVEHVVGRQVEVWGPPWSNVDASIREGVGVGYGVVARDGFGQVLWSCVFQERVTMEVRMAEAGALLRGVRVAVQKGVKEVVFESDCQEVINALQKGSTGRSCFQLVLDDILVVRDCNKVAHELANFHPWMVGGRFWSCGVPDSVAHFVMLDLEFMEN
ncbi:hypothetical protein RND81_03G078700 [Saponaria officinalis]|uniref:RNase H type-1 domain-containing protein n=1 Tax=Saponaria officinalis TaxID=3572 RepID=A0AAW1LYV4_SAPOF